MFVLENPFMQNMKSLEKHWLCLQSISIIQGKEKKQTEDKKIGTDMHPARRYLDCGHFSIKIM